MGPLISVIVPCRNYGKYLPETLSCLINQTYSNWECIVVDDSSTDDTALVAKDFERQDSRFKYLLVSTNNVSQNRNGGLRIAKGKYFQFLDADDLLELDKLRLQIAYLETHPAVDLVYGDIFHFNDIEASQRVYRKRQVHGLSGSGILLVEAISGDNIFLINAPLFRKSLIENYGYFDEDLMAMEDWELWSRFMINNASIAYLALSGSAALVRATPGSLSGQDKTMWINRMKARRKIIRQIQGMAIMKKEKAQLTDIHQQRMFFENMMLHIGHGNVVLGGLYLGRGLAGKLTLMQVKDALYFLRKRIFPSFTG